MNMKKIIFISLAFAFLKANTQTYQYVPFPTENAVWSESYYYAGENKSIYYEKFAINGEDTIINSIVYKKLFLFYTSQFYTDSAICIGGIREENKKIFYYGDSVHILKPMINYNNCNGNEILLYDFSLNIGDTIKEECFNGFLTVVITDIDTMLIGNQLRKVFHFNTPFFNWVEGIGNVNMNYNGLGGLLYYVGDIPAKAIWLNNYLICFKQNDTIVYFNSNYSECMPLNVPEHTIVNEKIVVAPNPSTTQLTFTIPENAINATYTLYDMQSISQLTGKASNTQIELNVSNLPRGLYVLKVVTDKQTFTEKVILH
jgi:hypothetical protein